MFAAALSALAASAGCTNPQLTAEDLEYSTVNFTPDVPTGNVATWWYELDYDGGGLVACNSNGHFYDATTWYFHDYDQSVRVYFGSEYEDYTLTELAGDLMSGRFDYQSSTGYTMSGDWELLSSKPCSGGGGGSGGGGTGGGGTGGGGTGSGSDGGGGGGGGGGIPPNSCNTSGTAEGCTSGYPYSCSAASVCYTTLEDCANDVACQL